MLGLNDERLPRNLVDMRKQSQRIEFLCGPPSSHSDGTYVPVEDPVHGIKREHLTISNDWNRHPCR